MSNSPLMSDDDDTPPGSGKAEEYHATERGRIGGRAEFLWFVTGDRKRDQIFPLADIRRMEPPENPGTEVAYIHLSGITVVLHGVHLRRVLHRITTHCCAALYEFRPRQKRPGGGEPVIERMDFLDMTKASR